MIGALNLAIKNIEYRRQSALQKAEENRRMLLENKEFLTIENKLGGLNFERAKKEVFGQDTTIIDNEIAKVEVQKSNLIKDLGFNENDLVPNFYCNKCKDTGRINGKRCECLENERIRLELLNNPELSKVPDAMKKIDFSVYGHNGELYKKCAKYLEENIVIKSGEKSIITMIGEAGIGKSYLAQAALRECLSNGDNVVVINAIKLNKLFLEYHCASIENKKEILTEINKCDVLLIDDLGVEPLLNNVTLPYLYELIIERMGKKTIITTNLSQRDIENRYDQRIFSRLMDKVNSAVIKLTGNDLRFK